MTLVSNWYYLAAKNGILPQYVQDLFEGYPQNDEIVRIIESYNLVVHIQYNSKTILIANFYFPAGSQSQESGYDALEQASILKTLIESVLPNAYLAENDVQRLIDTADYFHMIMEHHRVQINIFMRIGKPLMKLRASIPTQLDYMLKHAHDGYCPPLWKAIALGTNRIKIFVKISLSKAIKFTEI